VIDEKESLEIWDNENDYLKDWEPEHKLEYVTRWEEQDS
jgi:hypothetical protein